MVIASQAVQFPPFTLFGLPKAYIFLNSFDIKGERFLFLYWKLRSSHMKMESLPVAGLDLRVASSSVLYTRCLFNNALYSAWSAFCIKTRRTRNNVRSGN